MGTIINNMDEQYISIWELISLQLFLGSIIYIVGCIVLFFVLRKVENRKYKIALSLLVQFCISVLLSLIIESSNDMNSTFGRLPYFVIKDNNGRFGKFRSFMTKNYIYWFKYGHTILENYLNSKIRHPLQLKNQMKTSFKARRWL